jgi:N-acetylglutamate synthase-like GNAT family acetyltransferase
MSRAANVVIHHSMAPLERSLAQDLVALLEHKGAPWIDDIRRRIRGELPGAEDHYFVAATGQRLVAHAWYTVSATDSQLGLLGHVYTRPELRRRGLSRRLLEAAMGEFLQRGGQIMQLFTSTPFSVGFYEQLGFENLFTQKVYHDQDWYMRYPQRAADQLDAWSSGTPQHCRQLTPADLPRYSLLYNLRRDVILKDRAQQIGFGLEAELAFIDMLEAVRQERATCWVLENERLILGAAALVSTQFPHQSHIGLFDLYSCSPDSSLIGPLAERCLQQRADLGIEKIYAISVDEAKQCQLQQLGFAVRGTLPNHYRVGRDHYDCALLELS